MGRQAAFDHGVHRFDLPTLAVAAVVLVQAEPHATPITTGGKLSRRATVGGRNERANTTAFTGVTMIRFGIVPGIGENAVEKDVFESPVQERHEAIDIHGGSSAGHGGNDEMASTVDGKFELSVVLVKHRLFAISSSAAGVIGTGMATLKTSGVERGSLQFAFPFPLTFQGSREQAFHTWGLQEPGWRPSVTL